FFWTMPYALTDALENDFYKNKGQMQMQAGATYAKVSDLDLEYGEFQGIKFVQDDACPLNRAFLINQGAIGFDILKAFGPLSGDQGQGLHRIDGTLDYELIRSLSFVNVPLMRDCLGKLWSDSLSMGQTDAEL